MSPAPNARASPAAVVFRRREVGRPSPRLSRPGAYAAVTPAARTRNDATLIITTVLAASLAAGAAVAVAVRRWPSVGSPQFRYRRLARLLSRHPRLARALRADDTPERTAGLALVAAAVTLTIGAAAVGVLLLMIRSDSGFARLDLRLAEFAARHASDVSTSLMRTISLLGGTNGIIAAALVVARRRVPADPITCRASRSWRPSSQGSSPSPTS